MCFSAKKNMNLESGNPYINTIQCNNVYTSMKIQNIPNVYMYLLIYFGLMMLFAYKNLVIHHNLTFTSQSTNYTK